MTGTVIDSLIVTLGLDGSDYKKGADDVLVTNKKVMDKSNTMAASLESNGKQLADFWRGFKGEALAVLAILGGGSGLVALLNSAANAAAATARSAANVGTSVSKFSAWQAVAPQVGATGADVTSAFGTVSGAAQAQMHGQQNAAAAFIQNYLKVPLLNANGTERDTDDIMKDVASVYQKNNAVTDNWFNSQIGFSQGFGNELQMPDLIAQLGSLVTETAAQAKAAAAVTKQDGLVEAEMTALKNTLAEIAAPALTTGLHDFAAGIWEIDQTLNNPAVKSGMAALLQFFLDLATGNYIKAFKDLKNGAEAVVPAMPIPPPAPGDAPGTLPSWLDGLVPTNPRGLRNNNPLNLKYAGQAGATEDSDGFAVFGNLQAGVSADYAQLLLDQIRGAQTLSQLVTAWAPPGENNTAAYIAAVSKMTGIAPNQSFHIRSPAHLTQGSVSLRRSHVMVPASDLRAHRLIAFLCRICLRRLPSIVQPQEIAVLSSRATPWKVVQRRHIEFAYARLQQSTHA
jgi:hypothetical protein